MFIFVYGDKFYHSYYYRYTQNQSNEIYRIHKIDVSKSPTAYYLTDIKTGEKMTGLAYAPELQAVTTSKLEKPANYKF